jgi:hypothetical protein
MKIKILLFQANLKNKKKSKNVYLQVISRKAPFLGSLGNKILPNFLNNFLPTWRSMFYRK